MNCHYKGCERIPEVPVNLAFPKSPDARLSGGGTIWLCAKHFETLKFMLDIDERGGKDEIIEEREEVDNELRQEGGEGAGIEQGQ